MNSRIDAMRDADAHESNPYIAQALADAAEYGTVFKFREYLGLKKILDLNGASAEQLEALHEAFHSSAANAAKELDAAELLQYE